MPRTDVTVPTPDGACAATLHTPSDGTGPWPAIVLYQDAAGVRETMRAMADRLADLGYVVLFPDLYYRAGGFDPFDFATLFTVPAERARFSALTAELTVDAVVGDARAFVDLLSTRAEVAGPAVGVVGYCMGGRLALIVAAHLPDRVAAAASFHGGRLADPDAADSPHRMVPRIRGAVLVAAAQSDRSFPAEQYERLEQALRAAGVRHTIDTYPARHGFAVPDNPQYDEAAAERHWSELAAFFGAALSRPSPTPGSGSPR